MMKFAFVIATLVLVAAQAYPQGCNGRGGLFAFQGTRERHVVVTHHFSRGGCSGQVASTGCVGYSLVPQVTMKTVTEYVPVQKQVPVTTYVRVPVAPVVAQVPTVAAQAQLMPTTAVQTTLVVDSAEPRRAFPHPIRGLIDRIRALIHHTKQVAIAAVAIPVHRVRTITRVRGCP